MRKSTSSKKSIMNLVGLSLALYFCCVDFAKGGVAISAHIFPLIPIQGGGENSVVTIPPDGWLGVSAEIEDENFTYKFGIGEGLVTMDSWRLASSVNHLLGERFKIGAGISYFYLKNSLNTEYYENNKPEHISAYGEEHSWNGFLSLIVKANDINIIGGYVAEFTRSKRLKKEPGSTSCNNGFCKKRSLSEKTGLFVSIAYKFITL